jgi:hypothetical protein
MRTRLTTGEAAAFKGKVWPMLGLLTRARKRIDELGFDQTCRYMAYVGISSRRACFVAGPF